MSSFTAATTPSTAGSVNVRKRDWQTILLIGVAHASSHFFQLVLPSLYVSLGNEFGYDFVRLGFLVSTFYAVSGMGQASSGFLVDRIGARPVLWFGLSCFIVSGVMIGSANGYTMLVAAAALGGVGNSIFHPVDYSLINRRISAPRLGHAFSTHGLTGNLGWALTPVFMTTLILLANWRVAAFGAAALVAVVLVLTIIGRRLLSDDIPADMREPVVTPAATSTPSQGSPAVPLAAGPKLMILLRSPALWCAFLFFAFTSLALAAVQNYSIPLLRDLYSLSAVTSSSALSGYMLASAVGMLAGGFLVARAHTEQIVLVALILAGCTLVWLSLGGVPAMLAAPIVALAGFCAGVAGPSRDMLIRRVTPKGAVGSVYGLVYSGMDVGSAVAPLAFGMLLDMGFTSGPWIGAGMAFVMGAFLAQFIARYARMQGR